MKFMLILFGSEEGDPSPKEMAAEMEEWAAFDAEAEASGVFVSGEGLQPGASAKTLRAGHGEEPIVTDGPFAETKEQLGGFYVLDCGGLDEALEWARKAPLREGAIEVRPVLDYDGLASEDPAAAKPPTGP
jgi:hypothetical protein